MTATFKETPELRGSTRVRNPWHVVWLGVLLPFVYATVWFGEAVGELRELGRDVEDAQLSRASAGRSAVGMLLGWILVVPAVVVMVGTARRVQRAEGICFGTARPLNGVIATVVVAQTLALACVLTGVAILAPAVLLASAVIVMRLLQPRLNAIWETSELLPCGRTRSRRASRSPRCLGSGRGIACEATRATPSQPFSSSSCCSSRAPACSPSGGSSLPRTAPARSSAS